MKAATLAWYSNEGGRNICIGVFLARRSLINFRAFIQSALHGSNNPRYTANPSKVRYVNFFAASAPRRNHTA